MYNYFYSYIAWGHDNGENRGMGNYRRSTPIKSLDDILQIRKDLMEANNFKELIITFYTLISGPEDEPIPER